MNDFLVHVHSWLDRGESVQIVALPGMGKSRFGKKLGGFLLDTNLIPHKNSIELVKLVSQVSERRLIVIDSLDQLLTDECQTFFAYLKGMRDQHKYQLAYVFLTSFLIDAKYLPILGGLYELVSEHIEYLPALKESEYDLFGFKPTTKQLHEITRLSGGIPSLVKSCLMAMRDGLSLDPSVNHRLKAQIEEMISISTTAPAYVQSALIQDYLSKHTPRQLTAAETRLLDLLQSKPGQIVSKDQICQAVYPDVKNYDGVSDHALDQLIHRLRSKIKDKYTLTTHRGLGYKLN